MTKVFALVAAGAVACSLGVAVARAIVGGTPDNGAHPYVVLLKIAQPDGSFLRCTGVLVNGTKVITAAHCLETTTGQIGVFFGDGPITDQPPDARARAFMLEPGYVGLDTKNPDTHDLAVVTIKPSYQPPVSPTIATAGYTEPLPNKHPFTVVGYGIQSVKPLLLARTRYDATSDLMYPRDSFNLRLANNDGGACFGDSGGPALGGNVVVGILSTTQNKNCTASSSAYRLDTLESRAFLAANGALA